MGRLDDSATVEIAGKIMIIAIIVLFLVVVFVIVLHLYAKWFWWRVEEPTQPQQSRRRQRRRFVFTPGQDPVRRGLDLSIRRSLPVVIFQSKDFPDGLECAVCLSDVVEGEKARFSYKRVVLGDQTQVSTGGGSLEEGPSSASSAPSSSSSSSAGGGHDESLVIDVPVHITDSLAEDQEPKLPPPARLRSLKRLLSREKRVPPNCSNGPVDV
uniref:RING-H2 finger protein ATL3-like n=1 Tax=Populus alba TaxID=43335 RepID=A0A4U5QY44_POPAL|nr:hypothetical protein D5086_0000034960 [Populus alba]